MAQIRITKQRRTASARERGQVGPLLSLDPRDLDITRAKQLQRRPRKPGGRRLRGDDLQGARAETSP